ncbi:hypothetical protein [Zobellia galactanivorans]|uniref:Hypothetical membrane protein n=1 Tax=Zobellia galactanivorans (strain DSM 12802 / CCUG 47099 / CIP 106680 / NCIMB 13871 / Dsij) TaxID=63186 RepID=G0L0E6_ZOBGA|nr:hypothetical protein [Zobellia galactanivorans]CAZ94362.1 Hypothetical membrane protein [Zobellia galactanivorans]
MSKKSKNPLKKYDKAILKYVPKFFEILGWLTILGVLRYISFEKKIITAIIIYVIGLLSFGLYTQVFVFYEIKYSKLSRRKKELSYLIGGVLGLSIFWLLESIMTHLISSP